MAKGSKPAFVVRAKTGRQDGQDRDIFVTVGAAWSWENGRGYNVKIDTLPVNFDGYLLLAEPKDDERQ
jgi:hypothetical protein